VFENRVLRKIFGPKRDEVKGQVESSCEYGNKPSGSIKCWETIPVATQLVASRVVLSSIELAID
jgi:hypothetical protein